MNWPAENYWFPDVVIYHKNCDDGFGAALVAYRINPEILFIPHAYNEPLPDFEQIKNKRVLICDYSFPAPVIKAMAEVAKNIVILDHHKTANAALQEFIARSKFVDYSNTELYFKEFGKNVMALFDMERSGAGMTWDFFYPDGDRPTMIAMIEDADLWVWKYPDSKFISTYIRSFNYDFDLWSQLLDELEDEEYFLQASEKGAMILLHNERIHEKICESALVQTFDNYPNVPVVYCIAPFVSNVGNMLLQKHPHAPFAVCIVVDKDSKYFSLRSEESRMDVSVIAKRNGGGGHRNAAAFSRPFIRTTDLY